MGRPKGSKNKPKTPPTAAAPTTPPPVQKKTRTAAAPPPPPVAEAPRRGRPKGSKNKPKVVVPVVDNLAVAPATPVAPAAATTPVVPAPTVSKAPIPAAATVISRTEETDETQGERYTVADLSHPALASLGKHAAEFLTLASPGRKLTFENKADSGLTPEQAVLRTLLDFFEIDVHSIIAAHGKAK